MLKLLEKDDSHEFKPVLAEEIKTLTWNSIFLWYAIAIILCFIGSYLAYGPMTSDSWHQWERQTGYPARLLDWLRSIYAAFFSIFIIYCLDVTKSKSRKIRKATLLSFEWGIILVMTTLVLFTAYYVLPVNFHNDYSLLMQKNMVTPKVQDPLSFQQIWVPYFPYSMYVIGLWLGIGFPPLFFLVRSIRADKNEWRINQTNLDNLKEELLSQKKINKQSHSSSIFMRYKSLCFKRFLLLHEIAAHYVPLFCIVILGAIIEQLTCLRYSTSRLADGLGTIALWSLWVTSLFISIGVFLFIYTSENNKMQNTIDEYEEILQKRKNFTDGELKDVITARQEFEEKTGIKGLTAVCKTGQVSIWLFVALLEAGFPYFSKNKQIVAVVIPPFLQDGFWWLWKVLTPHA